MARLVIDLRAAPVSWEGAWWAASWSGIELCVRRDPGRDIAKMFLRAGRAKADDVIILQLDGAVIDEEQIGDAAKRKANPERLTTRLLLIAIEKGNGNG